MFCGFAMTAVVRCVINDARNRAQEVGDREVRPDHLLWVLLEAAGSSVIGEMLEDCFAASEVTLESLEKAKARVQYYDQHAEVGANYKGIVRKVIDCGAIVEILPGLEGLCHVSQLDVDRHRDALEKAQIQLSHAKSNLGMDDSSLTLEIQAKKLAYDRQKLLVADLKRQVDELNVRSPVNGQIGQLFHQNLDAAHPLGHGIPRFDGHKFLIRP